MYDWLEIRSVAPGIEMNDFMKWINPPPKTESAQDQTEAQDVDEEET